MVTLNLDTLRIMTPLCFDLSTIKTSSKPSLEKFRTPALSRSIFMDILLIHILIISDPNMVNMVTIKLHLSEIRQSNIQTAIDIPLVPLFRDGKLSFAWEAWFHHREPLKGKEFQL